MGDSPLCPIESGARLLRMGARHHMRVVMLIGGDDEVARACARATAPIPVVRSKHLDVAVERLRELRPLAIYIAHDVAPAHGNDIARIAEAQATRCIRLAADGSDQSPSDDDTSL